MLGFALLICWLLPINAAQRIENIYEKDLLSEIQPQLYTTYTPEYIEVRASILNVRIHGVYKRDDSAIMSKQNVAWYDDSANRPVYKKLASSNRVFYLYWSPVPNPQWRISKVYPVQDPHIFNINEIIAVVPSYAYTPCFFKGLFVVPSSDEEERQMRLGDPDIIGTKQTVTIPKKTGIPNALQWDNDVMIDEARPRTFSLKVNGEKESGCPSSKEGSGIPGLLGYALNPCAPPPVNLAEVDGNHLEFTMTGGDGTLQKAVFTWIGFFMRRPYFSLRSPLRSDSLHGASSIHPSILYLWAEGNTDRPPHWYLSREVGNKHASQLFARWALVGPSANKNYHLVSRADWPAEPGVELAPDAWVLFKPPIVLTHHIALRDTEQNVFKTTIQIKAELRSEKKIIIQNGPIDINGEYYLLGTYLGYPYFRQKATHLSPGYVLYRGHVIGADLDCWVIGAILGSIDGLRGYNNDENARWPHLIDVDWWFWDKSVFKWVRTPNVELNIVYNKASAVPAFKTQVFPQCPLPNCDIGTLPICPPSGTCAECLCKQKDSVLLEMKTRSRTDDVDFLIDTRRIPPREIFDANAIQSGTQFDSIETNKNAMLKKQEAALRKPSGTTMLLQRTRCKLLLISMIIIGILSS